MAVRRFRYSRELDKMVEVDVASSDVFGGHSILGEIDPFVSPVDGTVITSRSHLRRYMDERGLVHYEEAKTQKAESDRYAVERERTALRERLWEGVNRTFSMGSRPRR